MCNSQQADRWVLRLQTSRNFLFFLFLELQTQFSTFCAFSGAPFFFLSSTAQQPGKICCREETSSPPLTLWLRSIGFHSDLCSLCITAAWRKSIKTSELHNTASSPSPHRFHHSEECNSRTGVLMHFRYLWDVDLEVERFLWIRGVGWLASDHCWNH